MTQSEIAVYGVGVFVVLMNLIATRRILRHPTLPLFGRVGLLVFTWITPIIGFAFVLLVLSSNAKPRT